MSNMPWLRLYADIVDNEKLRLLAFEDRWHFVAIMCLKQQGIIDDNPDLLERKIAVKLGVQLRELDEIKRRLQEVDLIKDDWTPKGWDKKQFKSDSSAERVRKYREKKKKKEGNGDETLQKRESNAVDTDTDTDTDTENKFVLPDDIDPKRWKEWLKVRTKKRAAKTDYAHQLLINRLRECQKLGYTANELIDLAIERSWAAINPDWIDPKNSGPKAVNDSWGGPRI